MLPLSISRNRKADREKQVHNQAVQRAFERKAIREFVKANPDVLTDEEDLQDSEQKDPKQNFPSLKKRISKEPGVHQTEQQVQFFDVCNEKINTLSINDVPKAKKPKKKKTLTSEEKSSKKAAGGSKKTKKSKKKQANREVVTTKD